jgi:hypothetical protein
MVENFKFHAPHTTEIMPLPTPGQKVSYLVGKVHRYSFGLYFEERAKKRGLLDALKFMCVPVFCADDHARSAFSRWASIYKDQGCQMLYFKTKISNLGTFWRALERKIVVYLLQFGILYDHDINAVSLYFLDIYG